jgi:hypothetical protein
MSSKTKCPHCAKQVALMSFGGGLLVSWHMPPRKGNYKKIAKGGCIGSYQPIMVNE